VVGANYNYAKVSDNNQFLFNQLSSGQPVPTIPPLTHLLGTTDQNIHTYAAFGNIEYALIDSLRAHTGVRYTHSSRNATTCVSDDSANNAFGQLFTTLQQSFASLGVKDTPVVPVGPGQCVQLTPAPALLPDLYGTRVGLSESNVSWRAGLDYKLDNETLLYVNASRGYKSGVISNIVSTTTNQFDPAKQERVDAYEVGFKAPLFNHRVEFDTSGFYYNYADKQVRGRILDPVFGPEEVIVNVPKSRIYGVDTQLHIHPARGLSVTLAGVYLDSKVVSHFLNYSSDANAVIDFQGSRLPYAPKFTGNADVLYEWGVSSGLHAFVGSSVTSRSATNAAFGTSAYPSPLYVLPEATLLDLRCGLASANDNWRLTFYGRNVTDRYYWTFVFKQADTTYRNAGYPATYGVTLNVKIQ